MFPVCTGLHLEVGDEGGIRAQVVAK